MKKYSASSLQQYLEILDELIKNNNDYEFFYRGHSDVKYKLIPSLFRNDLRKKERTICNKIIREYPNRFINNTRLSNLIIMQHFGIPTRLLDFSLNPLIALYFAVTDSQNIDGQVIIAIVKKDQLVYEYSSKMKALACLSYLNSDNINEIKKYCENNKNEKASQTKEKIYSKEYKKEEAMRYFISKLIDEHVNLDFKLKNLLRPFMLLPNKSFDRISNQDGAFVVFGFDEDFLLNNPHRFTIIDITIPASGKKEILKQLRLIGIKDSVVYPSLESIARDILGKKANWVDYID